MKRRSKILVGCIGCLLTSLIAVGSVCGYNAVRKVDATANDNIKILYNGQLKSFTETNGSKISPVIINGRTYLPLRSVADLAGMGVEWEGTTQTIRLSSNGVPAPTQPANNNPTPASTPVSSAPANTSKSVGTLNDPIKLGETLSWSATEKTTSTVTSSADYTFTVKKVEPISVEEINKLGIKVSSDPTKIEYVMVTAEQTVSNAKLLSGETYMYTTFCRHIVGSKTSSGKSIIGGRDYGFTGSLRDNAGKATEDAKGFKLKIAPGQVHNYKYEGKILLPITKGEVNYMSVTKDSSLDYSIRQAFFSLK